MTRTGIVFLASAAEDGGEESSGRRAYRLESLFRELNRELSHRLRAGFQLRKRTREFGAILKRGRGAGAVLLRVWTELHPVTTRVVFVPGPVRVQTDLWSGGSGATAAPASLHQFAGPPLERAESLLESLTDSPSLLAADLDDRRSADQLRHLGSLLHLRLTGWTPRQLETYLAYRRLGSQSRTAMQLDVTQPTVSETLSRIDARATTEALAFFTDELDRALEEATTRVGEGEAL